MIEKKKKKGLICVLSLQSTSNVWMTHAEMEFLATATMPVSFEFYFQNIYTIIYQA